MDKGEIILYQPDDSIKLEVRLEDETVWLSQMQMAELFQTTRNNVTIHISNIFKEGELEKFVVCKESLLTTQHGAVVGKTQTKSVFFYNLDVIISVGYRIKSQRGTLFRIWATRVIKDYLLRGYAINQQIKSIERLAIETEKRVTETEKKIDFFVKTSLPPIQGVFFDGQIFDAYVFASNLIKSAKKSILLIDNYADETVLVMLSDRKPKVTAHIYAQKFTEKLKLSIAKHSKQYELITVSEAKNVHDRFLIIDDTVYHIGASLKDLGNKLFAFSKMEIKSAEILKNI
ncbi:MAG: virulence RhuM family protein [Chitinispirillales bacterium]|jgi:hypothetical protein|nr:virulence RhuM family protein [Chitinispirillales bacterium]